SDFFSKWNALCREACEGLLKRLRSLGHMRPILEVGDDFVWSQEPFNPPANFERTHFGANELLSNNRERLVQCFGPGTDVELAANRPLRLASRSRKRIPSLERTGVKEAFK